MVHRLSCAVLLVAACSSDNTIIDAGSDASPDVVHHDAQGMDVADEPVDTWDGALPVSCTGASPSFANDLKPIFASCGGELCHSGTTVGAWPYSELVNVAQTRDSCPTTRMRVVPSSLQQSYLMNKVTGLGMCAGSSQMPNGGTPLTSDKIQLIADWICQGALDN